MRATFSPLSPSDYFIARFNNLAQDVSVFRRRDNSSYSIDTRCRRVRELKGSLGRGNGGDERVREREGRVKGERRRSRRRKQASEEGGRERKRIVRESGRCVPAGSGVLIRWKEAALCWWTHEEAADRGSRRAAEFTPHLEQAPSCLIPLPSLSPLPLGFLASLRFAARLRHLFHLLLLVVFFFFVFARLVNASRRTNGRCTRSYLLAASLWSTISPAARR